MQVFEPRRHGDAVRRLWRAAEAGRLPHALSFEGPEGVGKFRAALWFASGLLCAEGPGEPCGGCGPCKRVGSGGSLGNHPDLLVIDPIEEGEERIRISRIAERAEGPTEGAGRSLESFLDLRALEGGHRPVCIREAHRMNPAAQNALLKTLEEPRPGTLLVLETHRPELLLPTIKSRVVRLRLEALDPAECVDVLTEHGVDPGLAAELTRLSHGSPGRALDLAARNALEARDILLAVARGAKPVTGAAGELWELEGRFPGKTPAAKARERVRLSLDLALELARERLKLGVGVPPGELAFGEALADLPLPRRAAAPRRLEAVVEELVECRADVERNLGPEAILDRALLVLRP